MLGRSFNIDLISFLAVLHIELLLTSLFPEKNQSPMLVLLDRQRMNRSHSIFPLIRLALKNIGGSSMHSLRDRDEKVGVCFLCMKFSFCSFLLFSCYHGVVYYCKRCKELQSDALPTTGHLELAKDSFVLVP